jgi:hypothetical protein
LILRPWSWPAPGPVPVAKIASPSVPASASATMLELMMWHLKWKMDFALFTHNLCICSAFLILKLCPICPKFWKTVSNQLNTTEEALRITIDNC